MDGKDVVRDFHLHTLYSDGLYTPRKLLDEASSQGVRELAITDHNSIEGLHEGKEEAEKMGITMVSGVEVSSRYRNREAHILGYCFHPGDVEVSSLYRYLSKIRDADNLWAKKVARLTQKEPITLDLGGGERVEVSISVDEIERFNRSSKQSYFHFGILVKEKLEDAAPIFRTVPARHVFYFLFRRKELEYIDKYERLFRKYGIENKKYWHVPREEGLYSPVGEVVEMIKGITALPVIAHPGETGLLEEDVRKMIDMGVKGIEVYTPKHDEEQTKYYGDIAEQYELFKMSGTDFHDPFHRNKVEIGRDRHGRKLTRGVSAKDLKRLASSLSCC